MLRYLLLGLLLLLIAGCATETGGTTSDPVDTVERYIHAKAAADGDTIRSLLCSEMEAAADMETRTFQSVTGVEVEDMTCNRVDGQDVVSCSGEIIADYAGENTSFPLVSYRVAEEDGEWKWCGEAG